MHAKFHFENLGRREHACMHARIVLNWMLKKYLGYERVDWINMAPVSMVINLQVP
jgi:hypothetical protein